MFGPAGAREVIRHRLQGVAARVQPERLVLFHLSDRYTVEQWRAQLDEVREKFPQAGFPEAWGIGG